MAMRRPPLNRGHSVPTYPTHDPTLPSLASLSLQDSRNHPAGELMRRGAAPSSSEGSRPSTPASQEAYSPYPSPSLSASSSVNGPHSQPHSPSYGPSYGSSYPSMPRSRSHASQPSSSSYIPPTNPPAITSPPANTSSALLRNRSTPPQSRVNLKIESSPHEYTLVAPLGGGFSSDSITIAARKGNVIVVVADRWDQEQDCHYEWQVQFDRDADMSSVHATFENGVLKLTVRRITNYIMRS